MTQTDSIQSAFLEQIRAKLAPNLSFVDELAELLSISRDSAYRRIRGETVLSLGEVSALSKHFGVSLDDFLMPSNERVSFQIRVLNVIHFSFDKWFSSILETLEMIEKVPEKDKTLIYDAKDLPIFDYFQFPRLSAFKIYFWMKTFKRDSKFDSAKYDPKMVDNKLIAMGEKIWDTYARIPSVVIIGHEVLTATLRQIEYAHDCGMFNSKEEVRALYDDCSLLASHLQHQAAIGSKQTYGDKDPGARFDVYLNEVLIGANTFYCKLGGRRITFITPNVFNLMMTTHAHFCELTEDHINNMMDKSVLISAGAEKERMKFFNRLEETIQALRAKTI